MGSILNHHAHTDKYFRRGMNREHGASLRVETFVESENNTNPSPEGRNNKRMANTYTQILVQIIFAVKDRQSFVSEKHREQVEKYICGIISNKQSKPLALYCNPDHCHVLIG